MLNDFVKKELDAMTQELIEETRFVGDDASSDVEGINLIVIQKRFKGKTYWVAEGWKGNKLVYENVVINVLRWIK